jgi:hypothetical protein
MTYAILYKRAMKLNLNKLKTLFVRKEFDIDVHKVYSLNI